jgi:hypothetical protein
MDVLEILLEIFGEIVLQVVLETLGELVVAGMRLFEESEPDSPKIDRMVASGLGFLVAGGLAGYWSALFVAHRVLPKLAVSGPSVVLAPLCAGLAMHFSANGGAGTVAIRPIWPHSGEAVSLRSPWRWCAGGWCAGSEL